MSDIRIELANCEATLLREITDRSIKRRGVAQTYWYALNSSERDQIDWKKVNEAIIARWSRSALEWIKRQAHSGKCFNYDAALNKAVEHGDTLAAAFALMQSLEESDGKAA